jgi:TatD DNase family protein
MNLNYIDIHSHVNLSPLLENKEAILAKMREEHIGTITVGTGLETSQIAIDIAESNPDICWATVGFHPCECGDPLHDSGEGGPAQQDRVRFDKLEELARHPKVVAIGETGLDYFHEDTPESRKSQTEIFKKHIELAMKVQKPLMLHVRSSKGSDDAYYDALEILKTYTGKANFHFFSGSKKCMEDIITAGFTVSVDGPITFVAEYDEMIKAVPLDKVMIETDAPFAAPKPYRGKTCEPWMVAEIARKIAELKGLDLEMVRLQLLKNTQDFFGIGK